MSHQAVTWALDASATGPLPAEARLVLIVMANWADAHGRNVYLSASSIADRLGTTTRSVRRNMATLRERRLILCGDPEVIPDHHRHDRRPVVYNLAMQTRPRGDSSVTPSAVEREATRPDSNVIPLASHGVTAVSARGDSAVRHGVTLLSPKTVFKTNTKQYFQDIICTEPKSSPLFARFADSVWGSLGAGWATA